MLWIYPAPGNIRYENICRLGRVVPAWGPGGILLGNCCRHVPLLWGANAQSAHMDTEDPGSLSVHVPLQPLHKGWHFYQDLMGDFSSMTCFFWHKKRGDTFQGWSVLCFSFCLSFILLIFVSLSLSLRWPVCSFFLSFVLYFFMCSLFFQCSFTVLPLLSLFYYIWCPFLCLFTFFSFSFLPFTFPCSFVFLSPAWNGINLHCLGRQEAVQECIAVSANGSKILFGENLWLTLCQKQWERLVSLIGCASLYPYTALHRS